MSMVVGIFSSSDALKSIIDGLRASGADLERLRALTTDEVPTELATSGVQFVWIGDVERGVEGPSLGSGGTGIPSSTNRSPNEVQGDELLESLSELGIPDGRTDDFAKAVEDGRMIVGYPSFTDSSALKQLFTSAGANSIEEF
ncbi:MAG TPA: hypothetical protein VEV38_09085 [Candidatus Eremiobacteraceae bacterium]|nr:hypothetical protein [Candidatus Eremiobacteraceae bacterium]